MARLLQATGKEERFSAAFAVAEAVIPGQQLSAQVHYGQVHVGAASIPAEPLGRAHQRPSEAAALRGRMHGEHPEVAARRSDAYEDGARQPAFWRFRQQERLVANELRDVLAVRSVSVDEEVLDAIGEVHEVLYGSGILLTSGAQVPLHGRVDARCIR